MSYEAYKPGFHFSGLNYLVNDPNGLVYYDGEYHLFFQYNILDEIYWGHAVSDDLVRFQYVGRAIYPDEIGQIWSGSAIIDDDNCSGLQKGEEKTMIAFFTYSERETGIQSQGMAYSNDRGRTFKKSDMNPIIPNNGEKDFRDPKVIWYGKGQKWIMILAAGPKVLFYESINLWDWNKVGEFGNQGAIDGVWECPDLFELEIEGSEEKKWILVVSVSDGAPSGGTGMQYFVGSFDGRCFYNENRPDKVLWVDHGKDFYAGTTWSHIPSDDSRRLLIGWADNWQYRDYLPTVPFKGQYSTVREITLRKVAKEIHIFQNPVKEFERFLVCDYYKEKLIITKYCQIELEQYSVPIEIAIDAVIGSDEDAITNDGITLGIKFVFACGGYFAVEYKKSQREISVDRRKTGLNPHFHFPAQCHATLDSECKAVNIRILMDFSQTEVFINNGEIVFTNLIFPYMKEFIPILYTSDESVEIIGLRVSKIEMNN